MTVDLCSDRGRGRHGLHPHHGRFLPDGGAPCIRRLRIPVSTVVGMVADQMTRDEILRAYPDLEPADIDEALRYAR